MERVTQISKRRGSQENLIMTEMPSYLASQDGFNEVVIIIMIIIIIIIIIMIITIIIIIIIICSVIYIAPL